MLQTLTKELLRGYETAMAEAIISRNSESITEVLDCLRVDRETLDRYCTVMENMLKQLAKDKLDERQ